MNENVHINSNYTKISFIVSGAAWLFFSTEMTFVRTPDQTPKLFCLTGIYPVIKVIQRPDLPSVLCLSEHLHQTLEDGKQALVLPSYQQVAAVVPQVNGCICYHPRLSDLCSELRCPQEVEGAVGRKSLDPVSG